jgi:hypothetical protein
MDRARLHAILVAYGADVMHWPEAERAAAQHLIAEDTAFAAERAREAGLDRLLAKVPAGEVTNALLTRILETAPRPRAPAMRAKPRQRALGLPSLGRLGGLIRLPNIGGVVRRPVAITALAVVIALGAGTLVPVANTLSDTDLLSVMWGAPSFNQDGANW